MSYSGRSGYGRYRSSYRRGNYSTSAYKKHEINSVDYLINNNTFGVTVVNNVPNIDAGGLVTFISGTKTGNNVYNRNGNSIIPKSIRVLGAIAPADYSTFPGPQIRMAIVYDRSPTSTEPTFTTIFQGIDSGGAAIKSGFASPNPSQTARFRIIRDYQVQLGFVANPNQGVVYSVSPAQINIKEYSKLWDKECNSTFAVQYNQNNVTTLDAVTTGAFYLVLFNSQLPGTMLANIAVRFSFMDRAA